MDETKGGDMIGCLEGGFSYILSSLPLDALQEDNINKKTGSKCNIIVLQVGV